VKSKAERHCTSRIAKLEGVTFQTWISIPNTGLMSIPVAARSKAWVYTHSLAGIAGSNLAGGMDACLL